MNPEEPGSMLPLDSHSTGLGVSRRCTSCRSGVIRHLFGNKCGFSSLIETDRSLFDMGTLARYAAIVLLATFVERPPLHAQNFQKTASTTLSLTVASGAAITVANSATTLAGAAFSAFTGTTRLQIKAGNEAGAGVLTVQVTRDSAGSSDGILHPHRHALTYTCQVAASGLACTGKQVASETIATPVALFKGDSASSPAGTSASLDWTLDDDQAAPASEFRATVIFTVSAT
jgi:hypothetical protein